MGLVIHPDQSTKQPVTWCCLNPACQEKGKRYDFERDQPLCPKCGADGYPIVQKRILIHFIVADPKGPIEGQFGRFRMACDPPRELLGTHTNGEAASGEIAACNCPGCLKVIGEAMLADQSRPIEIK